MIYKNFSLLPEKRHENYVYNGVIDQQEHEEIFWPRS